MSDTTYGPKATVSKSCYSCAACKSECYAEQGDSGVDYTCTHPSLASPRYIGIFSKTPEWCPALTVSHPAPQAPDTRIEQAETLLRKSGEALRTVLNATWEDQDGLTVFCEDKLPAHAYTDGHTAIAAIDAHLIATGKKRLSP